MAATVSNAGGLAGYEAYTLSPQEIYEVDKQLKAAADKTYNINNLWVSNTNTLFALIDKTAKIITS